jgi:hypothetical protein
MAFIDRLLQLKHLEPGCLFYLIEKAEQGLFYPERYTSQQAKKLLAVTIQIIKYNHAATVVQLNKLKVAASPLPMPNAVCQTQMCKDPVSSIHHSL